MYKQNNYRLFVGLVLSIFLVQLFAPIGAFSMKAFAQEEVSVESTEEIQTSLEKDTFSEPIINSTEEEEKVVEDNVVEEEEEIEVKLLPIGAAQPVVVAPSSETANIDAQAKPVTYQYTLEGLIGGEDPMDESSWSTGNPCQGPNLACYDEGQNLPVRTTLEGLTIGQTYSFVMEIDYLNADGVSYGFLELNHTGTVRADSGASGVSLSAPTGVNCNADDCLQYTVTFTATSDTAVIYYNALLSFDAADWPGSRLQVRLTEGIGGENIGNKTLPVLVNQIGALPNLTLTKSVVGGTSSANEWCFTVEPSPYEMGPMMGQTEFCINDTNDGGDNVDTVILENVQPGTYTITETGPDGYENTSITGENCSFVVAEQGEATVDSGLDHGQDLVMNASCTFTNVEEGTETGTITVYKDIIDSEGNFIDSYPDQEFEYEISGQANLSDTVTDTTESSNIVETGDYSIDEINIPDGFNFYYIGECDYQELPDSTDNSYDFSVSEDLTTSICIINQVEEEVITPLLVISKTNNKLGQDLFAGDNVTYTIQVTLTGADLDSVEVADLLPGGFTYRTGTWTSNSNYRGDMKASSVTPEPVYTNGADWNLGDMMDGEVVTLTYTADIGNVDQGLYKDLAWAHGQLHTIIITDANAQNHVPSDETVVAEGITSPFMNGPFVGTEINIINALAASGNVTVSSITTLPNTGASTFIVAVLGLIAMTGIMSAVAGVLLKVDLKSKNYKFGAKLFVFTFVCFLVMAFKTTTAGAVTNLDVRLEQPKTPNTTIGFDLNFVVLDVQNRSVVAKCLKRGPADISFVQFGSDINLSAGGNTASCNVDSSVVGSGGLYEFQISATAGGSETVLSEIVSVVVDNVAPQTPVNYSKNVLNSCQYQVNFTTANDSGETVKVEIYRSTNQSFTADSSSLAGVLNIGSNQSTSFSNTVPDCSKDWFYAVRAVDAAGNVSAFVADQIVTVIALPATQQNTTTQQGGGVVAGVGAGAGAGNQQVLGEQTQNTDTNTNNDLNNGTTGDVLGDEDEKMETTQAESSDSSDSNSKSDEESGSNKVLVVFGVIALIGATLGAGLFGYTKFSQKN